jgi:hypothetical protein
MAELKLSKSQPRQFRYGTAEYSLLEASVLEDEAQVAKLEEQIRSLQGQIGEIQRGISLKRVSMSQAGFLPLDILSYTFSFLDFEFPRDKYKMQRLATVSKAWRDAVLHTPSLWSHISLGTARTPSLKQLEAWASRAGILALDVSLHIHKARPTSSDSIPPNIISYLVANARRIGELDVLHSGDDNHDIEFLVAMLGKADRLHHLKYHRLTGSGSNLKVELPSLRSLAYDCAAHSCPIVAPHLTSLDVRIPSRPLGADHGPWNQFPALSSLTISVTSSWGPQNTPLPATKLPGLRNLVCKSAGSLDIGLAFLAEKGNSISRLTVPTDILSISSARIPQSPSVEDLTIISAYGDYPPYIDDDDMSTLMDRFPNLKTLEMPIGRSNSSWTDDEKLVCEALKLLVGILGTSQLTELRCVYNANLIHKVSLAKIKSSYAKAEKKSARYNDGEGPRVIIKSKHDLSLPPVEGFHGTLEWHQFPTFITSFVPKSW